MYKLGTVSPGAVPWGSAAHTGCAGRSRSCTEGPGWDCAIALGTTVISPAGDLKYSIDAPEFSTIVQPFMLVSYLLIILRTGWYMYMSGDDAALARVRVVKYREGVRLPLDNRTAR